MTSWVSFKFNMKYFINIIEIIRQYCDRRQGESYGYNLRQMLIKLRRFLSIILLLFSSILLTWASLPGKRELVMVSLQPSEMRLKFTGQPDKPAILETRQIRLVWPSTMRIGDQDLILLDFESENQDTSSPNLQAGLSDVYGSYNVMAEARFEVAGINVDHANPIRESLPGGQPVRFTWEIISDRAGWYDGIVWLFLRFLPLNGSAPSQEPIYVQEIRLHTTSFFGLSGPMARLAGWAGLVLGVLLIFNDMINCFRRRKRKITSKDTRDAKDL